ncbi:MAG: hypothetical protein KAU48_10195, partial [Candidatus Thorarchaeota archaeon]|nr:hypothetical protein [Candidatus Thorarchaeota archaeon]
MLFRRLIVTFLVLFFFITPFSGSFVNRDTSDEMSTPVLEQAKGVQDLLKTDSGSLIAVDPISGFLDPVTVEQYGFSGTGLLDTRTDSGYNDQSSIPIDNATGWVGSQAELEIWDMKRLYVENGTLDDGVDGTTYYPNTSSGYPYGWDFDWDDPSYGGAPGEQNVSTTYDKDEGYIILQTEGELDTSSGFVEYRHYDDTYIYWNQTINNAPYSDNLTLSFMYNYDSGIIDKTNTVEGWVWLDVLIDGVFVDYINLMNATECPSRNTWFEFVIANITNAPASFNLEIGISLMTWYVSDAYYLTNPGGDYDIDGVLDFDNARVNRVLLDNISLLSVNQPSYDAVDLTFNAGIFNTTITELSNYGTAVISNPSYWNDSNLAVGISSNVSISCDYEVKLLSHNFGSSLWTSQPTKEGVAYTIDAGESAALSTFTYVGNEGVAIYENFTVYLYLPLDWENVTVYDPFLNDETSQCVFSAGSLEIPTSLLNRLGWWQITLESPNYAKAVTPQIRESGDWYDNSLFRPGNITRTQVELGTASETPDGGNPVIIDWTMPNGTVWSSDSVSTIISGFANSSSLTFGGMNTSAGLWEVQVFWNNGTELAYGVDTFDLYHQASATVQYPSIETDYGLVISNQIVLTDTDNGEYILDDSVSMSANWSSTTVDFTPNFAKNWWQADFDTALLENGLFTVIVDITRPYFDPITVQFTVISTFETSLTITNAGPGSVENELFDAFTVQLSYELWNGTGIEGALPSVTHTGPQEGIEWGAFIDIGNGLYSLDIISNI